MKVRTLTILQVLVCLCLALGDVQAEPRNTPEEPEKDRSQWADSAPEVQAWYENQKITPETRKRLGVSYDSCCGHGDVFRTGPKPMNMKRRMVCG